jgi:hypothetical protein
MTNLENLLIYLRNDSGSNITFGSTVITPSESELIWDSVNFTTQPFNAFNNVLNNISVFNQNIFQSNLVMVNGVTDLTVQQAFDLFLELRDGYTNYNSELFTLYDKSNFEIIQFGQTILENGFEVGSRPKLNFIEGSGANLTILDDPVNNEVDLTISLNMPSLDGYVQTSRTISTGSGLSGGGDLSQNRTISIQQGLLDGYARFNNLDGYATVTFVNTQDNTIRTAIDGYARNTITISTGSGLSGGGNLTTNRTISLQSGLLDGYALSSTVTSLTNNLQAQVNFVEDTLDGYALRTRNINTGIGLTGGGNLISDRTISIAPGFLDGYSRNTSLDGYVPTSRTITAGTGLTGGGTLAANRTISLQSGLLDGYALTSTVTSLTNNLQAQINFVEDTLDGYIEGITVRRNTGSNIGTQPRINFIEGSGVNLSITNDSGNSEIDITISSSGGSGSGTVVGPDSSTDSAIALFDGYDGYVIKNSFATISSVGVLTLDVQTETPAIILSENAKGELIEGLNSELLDGQDGSFYTNASNLNSGTLNTARFNDTSHGNRGGGTLHSNATISTAGFMSGTDKSKLDSINLDGYVTDAELSSDLANYALSSTVTSLTNNLQSQINFVEDTLDGYARNSVTITAGSGLSGGGSLTTNRTISLQSGLLDGYVQGSMSSTDNAIARFDLTTGKLIQNSGVIIDDSNNLSGIGNITLSGTVDGIDVSTIPSTYALQATTISAGSGLSGGGSLATNRTISLQPGLLDGYVSGITVRENSGANVGTQPRLNFIEGSNVSLTITNDSGNNELDITIAATGGGGGGGSTDGYVYETRQIITGSGLSGGGDLSEDRTISIQQGLLDGYIDGITIRTNTGSNVGTQPRINFIEGSNITITATNDSGDDEIDVTISSSGGSSGGDGSVTNRYPFTWTGSSIFIPVDVAADFGFTEGTFQVEVRHLLQEDGYGDVYWFQGLTGLRYDGTATIESRPNFFPSSASWSSAGPTDGMLMDVIGATTLRFTVGVDAGFPTPASGVLYVKIIPLQT